MLVPILERLRDFQSNTCIPYLFGREFNKEYPCVHDEMIQECRSVGDTFDRFIDVASEPETDARSIALGRLDREFIDELCLPFDIARETAWRIRDKNDRKLGKPPRRDSEFVRRRRKRVNQILDDKAYLSAGDVFELLFEENPDNKYGDLSRFRVEGDIKLWKKRRNKSRFV